MNGSWIKGDAERWERARERVKEWAWEREKEKFAIRNKKWSEELKCLLVLVRIFILLYGFNEPNEYVWENPQPSEQFIELSNTSLDTFVSVFCICSIVLGIQRTRPNYKRNRTDRCLVNGFNNENKSNNNVIPMKFKRINILKQLFDKQCIVRHIEGNQCRIRTIQWFTFGRMVWMNEQMSCEKKKMFIAFSYEAAISSIVLWLSAKLCHRQ